MALKAAVFQTFVGALATDTKYGIKGSSAYLQGFDVRTSPSQMSVLPAATLEDSNVVSDLILGEVMTTDGTIYAYGDAGNIYRRATTGKWSNIGQLSSGCGGIDYRVDTDSIYLTSNKTVSSITGVVNSTPTVQPDVFAASVSLYNNSTNAGFNVNANQSGGAQTYVVPTTILESQPNQRFFQTDIEPVSKISVFVVAKGTGDWTLRLEDGQDNVLGTATIANANVKPGQFNDFVFSSAPNGQVRLYPAPNARTYHIHVISTVADGTISTAAAQDMSSCDLQVWADRLVYPRNGWHPMDRFLQYEMIGNGNYISAWEPITMPPTNAEWTRAQLTLPMEYDCCGVGHTNEYFVGAFEKTSTSTSSPQQGLIIFWDGTSPTYNYDVPITEGAPYGLHVYQNVVYYYAAGYLWAMTSPTTQPIPVRKMPLSNTEFSGTNSPIRLYPQAMTTRRGIQLLAYPGTTTNTTALFGVWSWGATDKNFQQALSYNYAISTGTQNYSSSNNLQIGMVKSFDDLLHISWRDTLNGGYGIDKVDNTVVPAGIAVWQSLVVDNGYAGKYKGAEYVEAYYSLPAGCTLQFAYQLNSSGIWVYDSNLYSSTNLWQGHSGYARFGVTADANGNSIGTFREIQMQVIVTTPVTTTTPAKFYMGAIIFDDKREETIG